MAYIVNNTSMSKEDFIKKLEERIIRGKYAVGEKLPTEREFEKQTGLGKSAIHGALTDLEHKGFIKIVSRKGAYVADFAKGGSTQTLNEVLRCNSGKLGVKMSIEIVELRNAVEGSALIRLAANHTDKDIAKLRAVLDELRAIDVNSAKIEELAEIESRFHMLICELSGNDIFSLVMNSFSQVYAPLWQSCALFWGVDGFIEHDEQLIYLIESCKGHEAQLHIENVFAQYLDAFYKETE